MKILFLSDNFYPERNAAATRVFERALYWKSMGHEITVITCVPNFPLGKPYEGYKNKWVQKENIEGLDVIRVKSYMAANQGFLRRILDFLSFMVMSFLVGLKTKNHDVICATSPQFFTAVSGWALSKFKRKPFIFELSDLWPASIIAVGALKKNSFLQAMEKLELFLYKEAEVVVALTYAFKEDLISRGINAEKIKVVRNGVDLARYSPLPKDPQLVRELQLENKFVVGYIGTHGMAHDLSNVIRAAKSSQNTNPSIHYLFVGAGAEKKKIQKFAKKIGLTNVSFVPLQSKEEISRYWSLCDTALAHLKNVEVFSTVIPSKIFEAMGMGLPITLVSPKGEASDIIEETQSGIWVPAGDPIALCHALSQLSQDQEKLKMYKENSLNSAPKHSRERQAKEFIQAIEL